MLSVYDLNVLNHAFSVVEALPAQWTEELAIMIGVFGVDICIL